jgi:hypothetical protein
MQFLLFPPIHKIAKQMNIPDKLKDLLWPQTHMKKGYKKAVLKNLKSKHTF